MDGNESVDYEKLDELVSRLGILSELGARAQENTWRLILTTIMIARVRPESRNYKRKHLLFRAPLSRTR